MDKELSYWLALAHTPKVKTKKKNEIIVKLFEQGNSIVDFFHSDSSDWVEKYDLTETEINLFQSAYNELPNYAFLVEDLLEQGYNILPITSKDYSPILKKNLGRSYAPPIIYTKGNLQILKEKSVAIVGSRKANEVSLEFTDNVALNASKKYKVVVSGFAKGVDKQALDSALKHKGQSIIVLPQGIATFKSGFKKYYKEIIDGDVLVLSTFYPKAPWSVQLAMARNPIIYGLASEIYVAESSEKGGTWAGVIDGLRKGRAIYVRIPRAQEKNANGILISKGAKPVDQKGNITSYDISREPNPIVSEPELNGIEDKIVELLKQGTYDSKGIVNKLKIDWTARKVTSCLKKNSDIEILKGRPMKFTHKSRISDGQTTLF
jgi:DNA processing protein